MCTIVTTYIAILSKISLHVTTVVETSLVGILLRAMQTKPTLFTISKILHINSNFHEKSSKVVTSKV